MSYRLFFGSNDTVNHSDTKITKSPITRKFKKFLLPIRIISFYVPDNRKLHHGYGYDYVKLWRSKLPTQIYRKCATYK